MFDNHLHVDMTQVIENSYIILLCMNQEYFESDYCRLGNQILILIYLN